MFCVDQRDVAIIYYHQLIPTVSIVVILSMFVLMSNLIYANCKTNLKISKAEFYFGILFFITVCCEIVFIALWSITTCDDAELGEIYRSTAINFYILQTIWLLDIQFYRLYVAFSETPLRLSKLTICSFVLASALISITFIVTMGIYVYTLSSISVRIITILTPLALVLMVFITCLFIYKIYNVYRWSKEDSLIAVITKMALLTCISTFVTILFLISTRFMDAPSPHFQFIRVLVILADAYTNFLAVLLCYKYFNKYYMKVCGCCDRGCHKLWQKCTNQQDLEMTTKSLELEIGRKADAQPSKVEIPEQSTVEETQTKSTLEETQTNPTIELESVQTNGITVYIH